MKIFQYIERYEPNCVQMSYLTMLEEFFKKFLDLDPDDLQNFISSSLSIDTSVINFFVKIRSVVFT